MKPKYKYTSENWFRINKDMLVHGFKCEYCKLPLIYGEAVYLNIIKNEKVFEHYKCVDEKINNYLKQRSGKSVITK